MSQVPSNSFIKSVRKHINDCSNPFQLRSCLNKYKSYFFTDQIKDEFLERISFFKEYYKGDDLFLEHCDELESDMELEIQIASVCSKSLLSENPNENHRKLVRAHNKNIDLSALNSLYFNENNKKEEELLRMVFEITNGNKLHIRRILKVSNEILNKKIKQYTLKRYLNKIRRDFRANISTELRG